MSSSGSWIAAALLGILYFSVCGQSAKIPDKSLVLVHVLFRHGNRTINGPDERYPLDPYGNKTYFPFGLGELTNAGKRKEWLVGAALRERYDAFLGDLYYPQIVEATSTDYNRTKVSLILALGGLFPPRGEEIWSSGNKLWQPVPYYYKPVNEDKVLFGIKCPYYLKLYQEYINTSGYQATFNKYRMQIDYIAKNTGLNITQFEDVYNLGFGLSTEEEYGLKLPEWTKPVWPKTIKEIAIQQYYVYMASTEMSKMAAGYHIKKIIDDTKRKIKDLNNKAGRKIYLYSAHENNLAQLMLLLDVFYPHIPNYGAYVILEVHRTAKGYGIKILYQNHTTPEPQVLKMPNCDTICPLEEFISLMEKFIPTDDLCHKDNVDDNKI